MNKTQSDAKKNLFSIRKLETCVLQNEYDTATVTSVHAGDIILPTGAITMADPHSAHAIEDLSRKTFFERVAPGKYPVVVYVARAHDGDRVGFAEIRFSNNMPLAFVPAKTIFDTENHHKGPYGYPVSYSRTGFMDSEVYRHICDSNLGYGFGFLDYDDSAYKIGDPEKLLHAFCFSEDKSMNAVQLQVENGRYYWYWGIASDKSKCCLIGDFFTYL